jgi:hypothetical protein
VGITDLKRQGGLPERVRRVVDEYYEKYLKSVQGLAQYAVENL